MNVISSFVETAHACFDRYEFTDITVKKRLGHRKNSDLFAFGLGAVYQTVGTEGENIVERPSEKMCFLFIIA